jgi:hypothetical protein
LRGGFAVGAFGLEWMSAAVFEKVAERKQEEIYILREGLL